MTTGLVLSVLLLGSLVAAPPTALAHGGVGSRVVSTVVGDECAKPDSVTISVNRALECGSNQTWRLAVEGKACLKVASTAGEFSCINTHAGLRWQRPLAYQAQACDPGDARISDVTLPPEGYGEGYVAAACIAIDWLERADATFPAPDVYVPNYVSAAGRASIVESAGWHLRFLWGRHTFKRITPTVFIFDSKSFLCTKKHSVLTSDFYVYRECNLPPREWTCADGPSTALGAPPNLFAGKKARAGFIGFNCSIGSDAQVNPWKFYLGMLNCDKTAGAAVPLCYNWSKGAAYIFGDYIAELGIAEEDGAGANLDLCSSAPWVNTCPSSPLLFRKIIPSSNWLTLYDTYCDHGSDVYGEGGNCSAAEHFGYVVNGLAFEWVVAHYGLDAAYGLIPATQAAKRNKALYLKILNQYLDISTSEFFAAIDEYVTLRLQGRVR